MKKFILIFLIISIITSVFAFSVNASIEYLSKKEIQGIKTNYSFNTVGEKNYVSLFFIGKTPTETNNGYFYLIIWHDNILTVDSVLGKITSANNESFYYTRTVTIEEANEIIFGDYGENNSIDVSSTQSTYVFQTIFSDKTNTDYAGGGWSGIEGDPSIVKKTVEEYYLQNILDTEPTEPTEKTSNELLSELISKIEITNFILLFMIVIHYVEKWLKLFVSGFDPHLK